MTANSPDSPKSIVLLCADRLSAENLSRLIHSVFPAAQVDVSVNPDHAATLVAARAIDLLVAELSPVADGDVLSFVWDSIRPRGSVARTVMLTRRCELRTLMALDVLPVDAVFDVVSEEPRNLPGILRRAAAGARYWSPAIADELRARKRAPESLFCMLSPTEQLVLATIGDGSDDDEAAVTLGLRATTVGSVRRNLHRKLGVRHRGELVRIAALNGFVRFATKGVLRPGLAMLQAACPSRRHPAHPFPV